MSDRFCDCGHPDCTYCKLEDKREQQLAEAQARIKVLEDAVLSAKHTFDTITTSTRIDCSGPSEDMQKALSTTSPTEALDKVVREAQNEMLDKVAESGLISKDGELYKSLWRIEP